MRFSIHTVRVAAIIACGVSRAALAGEWCTVTSALVSDNGAHTTISGVFAGASGSAPKSWVVLNKTDNADSAKLRASIALTAYALNKALEVYVDGTYTCISVPNWTTDVLLHFRIKP